MSSASLADLLKFFQSEALPVLPSIAVSDGCDLIKLLSSQEFLDPVLTKLTTSDLQFYNVDFW